MHPATSHATAEDDLLADPHANDVFRIHHLSRDTQRVLWHQRLAHCNARRLSEAHKIIKGVPQLPIATEIDNYAICLAAKLRKAARCKDDSRKATTCFQGLGIEFGFIVQTSENTKRLEE